MNQLCLLQAFLTMATIVAPSASSCSCLSAFQCSDSADTNECHDDELDVLQSIFPCNFISGTPDLQAIPPCAAAMCTVSPNARVVSLHVTPDLGDAPVWLAVPGALVSAALELAAPPPAAASAAVAEDHALPPPPPLLFRTSSIMPSPDATASASSGSRERHRIIRVRHLPPITITAGLTAAYARGDAPPMVCVRALWLCDAARAAVITQLQSMWSDGSACAGACLFTWCDWLRTSVIPFLLASRDPAIALRMPLSRSVGKLLPVRESPFAFFYDSDIDAVHMYSAPAAAPAARTRACLVLNCAELPTCGTREQIEAATLAGQLVRMPYIIDALLDCDTFSLQQHWVTTEHDCSICMCTRLGSLCVRLRACGHVFCRACLRDHVASLVAARAAPDAACPDFECARPIPPADVEAICGAARAELYMAYLEGVRARVEAESGVLRCPRAWCGSYVEVSLSSCDYVKLWQQRMQAPFGSIRHDFGRQRRVKFCEACKHSECVECGATWHGVQPCTLVIRTSEALVVASTELLQLGYHRDAIQGRLFPPRPRTPPRQVEAQQVAVRARDIELQRARVLFGDSDLVESANADSALAVDPSYDLWGDVELWHAAAEKHAEGAMDAIKQAAWLAQFTRKCPSCGALTEKITGCNHMSCAHCSAHFCWLCGEGIKGYEHFASCKGGGTFDAGSAAAAKITGKDLLGLL